MVVCGNVMFLGNNYSILIRHNELHPVTSLIYYFYTGIQATTMFSLCMNSFLTGEIAGNYVNAKEHGLVAEACSNLIK